MFLSKNNMSCEISVIWIGVVIHLTTPIFYVVTYKNLYHDLLHIKRSGYINIDTAIIVPIWQQKAIFEIP